MSVYLYISGNGFVSNFGSLNDKKAATALQKKMKSGKVGMGWYCSDKNADILKSVGGVEPGDEDNEFRILNESGKVIFSLDNTYNLPYQCFYHRFIKIDDKNHPFFWRSMIPVRGDFFLFEDEDGHIFEDDGEEEILDSLKENLRIQVTHLFWGDKEIACFVDDARFDGVPFKDVAHDLDESDFDDKDEFELFKDGYFTQDYTEVEKDQDEALLMVYRIETQKQGKAMPPVEKKVFAFEDSVRDIPDPWDN